MPRRDTRGAILTAAETVSRRGGLTGTTTKEVAAQAGCSEAAIYYHFKDRTDLLAEMVAGRFIALSQLVREQDLRDAADAPQIERLLDIATRAYGELIGLSSTLFADPSVLRRFRDVLLDRNVSPHDLRTAIAAQVEAGQDDGWVRADVDAAAVATLIAGACHELALHGHLMGEAAEGSHGDPASLAPTLTLLLTPR